MFYSILFFAETIYLFIFVKSDFSDKIREEKKVSYSVRKEDETDEEKFSRLQLEITELQQKLNAKKQQDVQDVEDRRKNMLEEMEKWMQVIEKQARIRVSSLENIKTFKGELECIESINTRHEREKNTGQIMPIVEQVSLRYKNNSVAELEQRLHELESRCANLQQLGYGDNWNAMQSIGSILERMSEENAEKNLRTRIDTFKKILQKEEGAEGVESIAKINEIYSSLSVITKLKPDLLIMNERLKTLATLHADSGYVRQGFIELESNLQSATSEMVSWKKTLQDASEKLAAVNSGLEKNSGAVEKAISALEKRVSGL